MSPPSSVADPNIKRGGDPNAVAPIIIATTFSTVRVARVFRGTAKQGDELTLLSPGDNINSCTEFDPIPEQGIPYVLSSLQRRMTAASAIPLRAGANSADTFETNGLVRGIRNGSEGIADVVGQSVEDLAKLIDREPKKAG